MAESDSLDAESGFDESEQTDVAAVVTKFVSRFVDKVCNDAGVLQKHVKDLHQMIPGQAMCCFQMVQVTCHFHLLLNYLHTCHSFRFLKKFSEIQIN